MVKIKNVGKKPFATDLPHDIYCRKSGKCNCEQKEMLSGKYDNKDGVRTMTPRVVKIPRGLHVATGETVEGLHDSVLLIPSVARAVKAGTLVVVKTEEKKAPQASQGDKGNKKKRS